MKRAARVSSLPAEEPDGICADEDTLEKAYLREERKITVHRALSKIKAEYSRVLYLKFFEELSNEQIAAVMKKNRRQIENLIYQAKRSLRAELNEEGFSCEEL